MTRSCTSVPPDPLSTISEAFGGRWKECVTLVGGGDGEEDEGGDLIEDVERFDIGRDVDGMLVGGTFVTMEPSGCLKPVAVRFTSFGLESVVDRRSGV